MSLGKWDFYQGLFWGKVTVQELWRQGWRCVPLAQNSWIELLTWYLAYVRLQNVLCSCLVSLFRLTRYLGLGTILESRHGYEFDYLPCQGSIIGSMTFISLFLWTQIRQDYVLNSVAIQGFWFCSADGVSHGYALFLSSTVSMAVGWVMYLLICSD